MVSAMTLLLSKPFSISGFEAGLAIPLQVTVIRSLKEIASPFAAVKKLMQEIFAMLSILVN